MIRENQSVKIKDVIPAFNGFFAHIISPIYGDEINPTVMDIDFIAKHGERTISPLVKQFMEDGKITDAKLAMLANYLHLKYKAAWRRYGVIHAAEYDPQITINMNENETTSISGKTLNKLLSSLSNEARTNGEVTDQQLFKKFGSIVTSGSQTSGGSTTENGGGSITHGEKVELEYKNVNDAGSNKTTFTNRKDKSEDNITKNGAELHYDKDSPFITSRDRRGLVTTTHVNEVVTNEPISSEKTEYSLMGEETTRVYRGYGTEHSAIKTDTTESVTGYGSDTELELKKTSVDQYPTLETTTVSYGAEMKDGVYVPRVTKYSTSGGKYTNTSKTADAEGNWSTVIDNRAHVTQFDQYMEKHEIDTTKDGIEEVVIDNTRNGKEITTHSGTDSTTSNSSTTTSGSLENTSTESYNGYIENTEHTTTSNSSTNGAQSKTDNGEESRDEKIVRSKSMEGDMGVNATSDLLRKEYDFWSSWNYIDAILLDVANELGLQVRRA